jgi:hypothetical protein
MAVPVVVSGTWLLSIAVCVGFISRYGLSTPYWDDWNLVPYAAGRVPISLQWLWSFQQDHRIPLPKLAFVSLYRIGQADVRVIMLGNVAILAAAALLALLVLRRRGGGLRLTDAVIPLTLVGIANYANLVSANQVQYISSIGLFCVIAYVVLKSADWFTLGSVALVGVCAVALPLTGSTGLALAVPIVVLLPLAAWRNRNSCEPGARPTRWLALGVSTALVATIGAYNVFASRPATPDLAVTATPQQFFTSLAQLAAVGFAAPRARGAWVPSGPPLELAAGYFAGDWVDRTWKLRATITVVAAAIAVAGWIWAVARRRRLTLAELGPLTCLASAGMLAFAIAYARASALEQRYVVLGATLLVTIYVCLRLLRSRVATLAGWALALTAVILLPWNAAYAIVFGQGRQDFQNSLIRDIQAGTSVDVLGTRYYPDIWGDPSLASQALREMRDDHIGAFASGQLQLNDKPPVIGAEETLSTEPVAVHNMTRVGNYWEGTGGDSFLLYSAGGKNLAGIRLDYSLTNPSQRPAYLQLTWSDSPTGSFDANGHTFVVYGAPADGQPQQAVAWIDNSVGMLKVTPDTQAASFKLDNLVLLLTQ